MTFDFRRKLTVAAAYSDGRFAAFLLESDPLAGKLSLRQREEIIAGSLHCGATAAQQLSERFASAKPAEIARLLGLRIVAGEMAGPRLVLSAYDPHAATITLNRELMAKLKHVLEEERLLPTFDAEELAIAHELFHCLENSDAGIFSRQFKITAWRLGPFQYRSTVQAASEIAATICAKTLCQLVFNPVLLEPVILRWAGAESAEAWFDRLERVTEPASQ
jgi:hypothetical protein